MTDTRESSGLSEERLEILRLVENQTVTAEEAGRLLEALDRSDRSYAASQPTAQFTPFVPTAPIPPPPPAPSIPQRSVRIRITNIASGKPQINLVLPYRLVDSGIKLAKRFAPEHLLDSRDIRRSIDEGFSGPLLDLVDGEQRIEIIVEGDPAPGGQGAVSREMRRELRKAERDLDDL